MKENSVLNNRSFRRCSLDRVTNNKHFSPFLKFKEILHLFSYFKAKSQKTSEKIKTIERTLPKRTVMKASLILETAVIFPVVTVFLLVLIQYMAIFHYESLISEALYETAREISIMSIYTPDNELTKILSIGYVKKKTIDYIEKKEGSLEFILGEENGISFARSFLKWGNEIDLIAEYALIINDPLSQMIQLKIPLMSRCVIYPWSKKMGFQDKEEEKQLVYVTSSGSAYHSSPDCPYLKLSIKQGGVTIINDLRNEDGSKYYPCECFDKSPVNQVYYTDYGQKYHSTLNCEKLKRTIYSIFLEDVGYREKCKKCFP